MGNPTAQYYKAYYISEGWSDLEISDEEKYQITAELYKETADYGNKFPEAQLRYGLMVKEGKVIEKNMEEAIQYLIKAADNDHVAAMYEVATYYFSNSNYKLGKYYMIKAAKKICRSNILLIDDNITIKNAWIKDLIEKKIIECIN